MRYSTIVFDWGDTLSYVRDDGRWDLYPWAADMIRKLYENGYRLGIISNTHRYSDAAGIKYHLQEHKVLRYFECIISSATYAIHKPDLRIFEKLRDFMEIDLSKALMVGDSEKCDGAGQYLLMDYMKVSKKENWRDRLYAKLEDPFPKRKSNLYEYTMFEGKVITKLRHMNEVVAPGDRIIIGEQEFTVVSLSREYKRDEVYNDSKDDFIMLTVKPVKLEDHATYKHGLL